jgi:hypothetical protein
VNLEGKKYSKSRGGSSPLFLDPFLWENSFILRFIDDE